MFFWKSTAAHKAVRESDKPTPRRRDDTKRSKSHREHADLVGTFESLSLSDHTNYRQRAPETRGSSKAAETGTQTQHHSEGGTQTKRKRSGGSDDSGGDGRDRANKLPHSQALGHRSRSSTPEAGPNTIGSIRLVGQVERNSEAFIEYSLNGTRAEMFRLFVFGLNLGLFLLESRRGRDALYQCGHDAYAARDRNTYWVYQGGSNELRDAVNLYLRKIRRDPPNFVISDRVGGGEGEGVTRRTSWRDSLQSRGASNIGLRDFSAKIAGVIFLSHAMMEDALQATRAVRDDGNSNQDTIKTMHRFLFNISIICAHELVHLFLGFLSGDESVYTPHNVSYGSNQRGELGRLWEGTVFGHFMETYRNDQDSLGRRQAGELWANRGDARGVPVGSTWICQMLEYNFQPFEVPRGTRSINLNLKTAMSVCRNERRPIRTSYISDLPHWLVHVNSRPAYDISESQLSRIKRIPQDPRRYLEG